MRFSLPEIQRPDGHIRASFERHLDNLTKPPNSLGRLETLARDFGVMRGSVDLRLSKRAIFTFAADHGVSRAGVSAYPREVTAQMVFNFLSGGAGLQGPCPPFTTPNVLIPVV